MGEYATPENQSFGYAFEAFLKQNVLVSSMVGAGAGNDISLLFYKGGMQVGVRSSIAYQH